MAVTPPNSNQNTDVNVDDILKQAQPPKSGGFKRVLTSIGKGAANIILPGLGGGLGGGISARLLGAAMPTLGTDTTQYLAMQNQLQQEQIAFEMVSTVLKIRADSSMSAIRNMQIK
ncbi:MAG TPA: hypothetical protein VKE70_34315 [Candidatus Solibacter sp.]|nr:hypothetical protein [Candidatus Solibacter sp.]